MRLTLFVRMLAAPAAAIAMMLLLAGVGWWAMRAQSAGNEQMAVELGHYAAAATALRTTSDVHTVVYRTMSWIASYDAARVAAIAAAQRKRLDEVAAAVSRFAADGEPDEVKLAATIGAQLGAYRKFTDQALDLATDDVNTAMMYMQAGDAKFGELVKSLDELVLMQARAADECRVAAEASAAKARLQGFGVLIAALIVVVVVGFLTSRGVLREVGGEPGYAVEVVRRIAEGDLTKAIELKGNDTTSLLSAMKGMQERLTDVVSRIKAAVETVDTGAREIASGNADLSQRTEEQASSLEETASSMEELTATVKQNADNAKQANQLAIGASTVAAKGGEVVGDVVETMNSIAASSKKIADIIGVIDGIAFQTNILALNAAVEAARAGEQGRGFAVVASEVRSLAQRSAAAAKEIKELIGDSVSKVDSGTKLVGEAGTTMAEVVASVKRVTDIMAEITAASQEQSSGIEQVNQAIVQMDQVTQQNAALVEESAAAAESMQEQASTLAATVAVFRVEGGAAASPAKAAIERAQALAATVVERAKAGRGAGRPLRGGPAGATKAAPRRLSPPLKRGS